MTFTAALALAKDLFLVAAVGAVLWFVAHAEHNADQLKDLKATLGQQQRWQDAQTKASGKANDSLQALTDRLDAIDKRGPIIVRVPGPAVAAAAASSAVVNAGTGACAAGANVRSVDIRPVLESPERTIATAMIKCQQVLDSWPK